MAKVEPKDVAVGTDDGAWRPQASGVRVLVAHLTGPSVNSHVWANLLSRADEHGHTPLEASIQSTFEQYVAADERRRALTVESVLRTAFSLNAHIVVFSGATLTKEARDIVSRYSARLSAIFLSETGDSRLSVSLMSPFDNHSRAAVSVRESFTFQPTLEESGDSKELTVSSTYDIDGRELRELNVAGVGIEIPHSSLGDTATLLSVSSGSDASRASEIWRGYWLYPEIDFRAEELRSLLDDLNRVDDPDDFLLNLVDRVNYEKFSLRESRAYEDALNLVTRGSRSTAEAVILPESVPSSGALGYDYLRMCLGQVQSAIANTEAMGEQGQREDLQTLWDHIAAELKSLSGDVPTRKMRYEDRPGSHEDSTSRSGTHTVFSAVLSTYSNEKLEEAFTRQGRLLAVVSRMTQSRLKLTYRILSTRGFSVGLTPVVQVRCVVEDATAVEAAALRTSVGELVHAAFVGLYGISFSFDSEESSGNGDPLLWRSGRYSSSLSGNGGDTIRGFPDWAYLVDYLCSLDSPTVLELSVRPTSATGAIEGAALQPEAVEFAARESIVKSIRSSGVADRAIDVQVAASSDDPLPSALLEFIAVEVGGGSDAIFETDLNGWIPTTIGRALQVFHPPFGRWYSISRSPAAYRRAAPQGEFPPSGMPLGRADVSHPKGTKKVEVRIPDSDRLRHAYVIGRTGSGKTNLLRGMASHELRSPSTGMAVIDPHGDLASHVLNSLPEGRRDQLQLMNFDDPDIVPVLNPLLGVGDDPLRKSQVVQEVLELLKGRVYHEFSGPRFDAIVRLLLDTMLDSNYPYTPSLVDAGLLLTDDTAQKGVRKSITDHDLLARWKSHDSLKRGTDYPDLISWVVSKFDDLRNDSTLRALLGGSRNTIDVDRLANENGVLVVSIPESVVGSRTAEFIGSMVLMRLRAALLSPGRRTSHVAPFFVYVDEFQKFANADFETFLAEARKFGVGLVMAHQNIAQLRMFSANTGMTSENLIDSILGNVGTLAVFPVNASDAQRLASQLDVDASDLTKLQRFHCVLRPTVSGVALPSFTIRTEYSQPALDPRLLDETRQYLVSRDLVVRRVDAEREVQERHHDLLQDSTVERAKVSSGADRTRGSSFLDEWLKKRERVAPTADGDVAVQATAGSKVAAPAAAPPPRNWSDVIGPVATANEVAGHIGMSLEALTDLARRGGLLVLETSDGMSVLPTSHVMNSRIVAGLSVVVRTVSASPFSTWTQAAWLASPSVALGGASPIDWLRDGGDLEVVVNAAHAYAEESW
ncbi:DUF87 domain-containing protein [Nocardioides oleivorans]|uniref:DUF87 domain-containing protein n=1 Tax=Nocardioides oleivorans TaxID=273676 RepID=A0A4Q2RSP9_9ACTN|nr:DUF87 domain-containing protein [Nocardioides oleivorans]RYB91778.1 DUF87 domain-containing protein [Nocardioides oleivorans]